MAVTFLTNEDKTIIDQNIAQLSEEIVPLNDNLNNTVKSGTEIVYDCAEGQCICVEGDTEDEVTLICSGKNLFPALTKSGTQSGITYTLNDDGSVHVSGTATSNIYLYIVPENEKMYLPAGDYVIYSNIQLENKNPGGYICFAPGTAQFSTKLIVKDRRHNITLAEGGTFYAYLYLSKDLTIDTDIWWAAERIDDSEPTYTPTYSPYVTSIYKGVMPLQVVTHEGENTLYTVNNDHIVGTYYKIKTAQNDEGDLAWATPEMYGAKRDGISDDAPAIQQAINSGKSIVLGGDYTIKSAITIPSGARVDCDSLYRLLIYDAGEIVLSSDALLSNTTIRYYGDKSAVRIVGRKATVDNCKITGSGTGTGICVGGDSGIANAVIGACRLESFECAVKLESETWINGCTVDIYTDECKQSCVAHGDGHILRIRGQSARLTVNNNEVHQIVINGNFNRIEETLFDVGLTNNCVLGFAISGQYNTYEGALSSSRYAQNSVVGSANRFTRPSMFPDLQTQPLYTKSNWAEIITGESVVVNVDLTTVDIAVAESIKNCMLNKHTLPSYQITGDTVGVAVIDVSVPRMTQFVYAAFEMGAMHYIDKISIELIPEAGDAIVLSNGNNDRLMYLLGSERERALYSYNITKMRFVFEFEGYAVDFIGASGLFG